MELPADVTYIEDVSLFIWRPHGVLDEAMVNKILAFVADQENKLGRPFHRFTDMSALKADDLSFKYVFHVALYRRLSRAGREMVKSAFLVTDPEIGRYIKLHGIFLTGRDDPSIRAKLRSRRGLSASSQNPSRTKLWCS